jgi:transcriptional regulator with XRE-family HTH domain
VPSARELFGKQIRALRIGKKLSQERLAEMCGLHRNYPGRVERAELDLSFSYAMKLSVGLGVKPMELFRLIPKLTLTDPDTQPKKNKKEK